MRLSDFCLLDIVIEFKHEFVGPHVVGGWVDFEFERSAHHCFHGGDLVGGIFVVGGNCKLLGGFGLEFLDFGGDEHRGCSDELPV